MAVAVAVGGVGSKTSKRSTLAALAVFLRGLAGLDGAGQDGEPLAPPAAEAVERAGLDQGLDARLADDARRDALEEVVEARERPALLAGPRRSPRPP